MYAVPFLKLHILSIYLLFCQCLSVGSHSNFYGLKQQEAKLSIGLSATASLQTI